MTAVAATVPRPVAVVAEPADLAVRLMRQIMRHNLQPELAVHPSWLPAAWPARYRPIVRQFTPKASHALGGVLRRSGVLAATADYHFDSRRKRLLLLDGQALRRLSFYLSLCAHAPLLRLRRDALAAQLRRQARRLDVNAVEFVLDRAPQPTEIRMSDTAFRADPWSSGRLLMERGYRLLLATVLPEGESVVRCMQLRFPKRAAALNVPALQPRARAQLEELILSCIVPERMSEWDWLF